MIEHDPPKHFPPSSLVAVNVPADLNKVIIAAAARNGVVYEDQLLAWALEGERFDSRFFSKVDKNGPVTESRPDLGPCWIWTAYKDPKGYGRFRFAGESLLAHRLLYEIILGELPDDKELDHLCRVRHCVRSSHLEPVSGYENWARGESISAKNLRKTHCDYGHRLDGPNLYLRPDGDGRQCLECKRATKRKFDLKNRRKK